MKIETFKNICKEKINKKAFEYLENKKKRHEKVRHMKRDNLEIAACLKSSDIEEELSIRERQFLFQCRVSNIDIRANRTWKYAETHCIACKDKNIQETGAHILECKILCNQSNVISYIPDYNDLFSSDIQEQIYVSRIMHSNLETRKAFLKD